VVRLNCESTDNIMNNVSHAYVCCYYNSCTSNAAKCFPILQDNDFWTVFVFVKLLLW
jgi:hypothetical protein